MSDSHMVGIVLMALMTITVLTVGTLMAAELLPRPRARGGKSRRRRR